MSKYSMSSGKILKNVMSSENSGGKAPEVLRSADLLHASLYAVLRNGYSLANFTTIVPLMIYLFVYYLLIYLFVLSSATL
jgi:hypothetical protein